MSRERLVPALLVLATLVVFAPVARHDFVTWDDDAFVYQNPDLNPPTRESVRRLWSGMNPLTNTTYALLALAGPAPRGTSVSATMDPRLFHGVNLVLHALAALVVYAILRGFVGAAWAAGAGALLFAIHPVQVEPVAWATGLKDVLCGLLSVVALDQYLRHARGGPRARAHWLAATTAFGLALLAKPTAVTVPLAAWVLDRWLLDRSWRASLASLAAWFAVAAAWGLVAKATQSEHELDFVTPFWGRPLLAADALAFYATKVVVPIDLGVDYGRTPERVLAWGWSWCALIVGGVVAVAVILRAARRPWATASVGLFVAGLVPVLGLVPFHFQHYSTVADRYLYTSMLGPALAIAWIASRHAGKATTSAVALATGTLAVLAAHQLAYWHDSASLLQHAIDVNPGSWAARDNLGGVLSSAGRLDEALAEYEEAVRLKPDAADIQYNLANVLLQLGRPDDAVAHYAEALRLDPTFVPAHFNWASILVRQGHLDDAIAHYAEAVRVRPDFAAARTALERARAERERRASP
jgi:tetratricopeptide (TPR) repeat protein